MTSKHLSPIKGPSISMLCMVLPAMAMAVWFILIAPSVAWADIYNMTFVESCDQKEARAALSELNEYRANKGLNELKWDYGLEQIALQRAAEADVHYLHSRPDGSSFKTCTVSGFSSQLECLDHDQYSISDSIKDWEKYGCSCEDRAHDSALLSSNDYSCIGMAYVGGVLAVELGEQTNLSASKPAMYDQDFQVALDSDLVDQFSPTIRLDMHGSKSLDTVPFGTFIIYNKTGHFINNPNLRVKVSKEDVKLSSGDDVVYIDTDPYDDDGIALWPKKLGKASLSVDIDGWKLAVPIEVVENANSGTTPSTPDSGSTDVEKDDKSTDSSSGSTETSSKPSTGSESSKPSESASTQPSNGSNIGQSDGRQPDSDSDNTTSSESSSSTDKVILPGWWSSSTSMHAETIVSAPAKTSIAKLAKAKKAFTVKWKKRSGVAGYQIRYSLKSSMKGSKTVTVKTAKATAKKVSKLKKKKKYYVQVRTYKVVNGKTYWSGWSAKKAVKTK